MCKKIISIIIALTITISASGLLSVRSFALGEGVALAGLASQAIAGYSAGLAANEAIKGSKLETINGDFGNNLSITGDILQFIEREDGSGVIATANPSFADQEAAQFIASQFNKSFVSSLSMGPNQTLTVSDYESVKSAAINAYSSYLASKAAQTGSNPLTEVLGYNPTYSFDFVGPIAPVELPTQEGLKNQFLLDGVKFYKAHQTGVPFYTAEEAKACGATWTARSGNTYIATNYGSAYGYGYVLIYDGVAYYYVNNFGTRYGQIGSSPLYSGYLNNNFRSADGVSLNDVLGYNALVDDLHLTISMFELTQPTTTIPFVSGSDFIETTGGGTLEIPNSQNEDVISAAIAAGLLVPGSLLTVDEYGNIISADGIDLSKISEILEALGNDLDNIKDYETYLQTIIALLQAGNLTAEQERALLGNINSKAGTISANLTDILSKISAISISIGTDITAKKDFDVKTPSIITDKFPFCLPYDVHRVFNLLSANPKTPKFDIPFDYTSSFDDSASFHQTISIDLTDYNWIAEIVRWFLYIIFVLGLILVTNKLLGRG